VKTILIALDGSELSETVLPVALTIASECEYHPVLLSVWETATEGVLEPELPEVAELTGHGTEYLQSYLHTLVPTLERMDLPVTIEVRAGHPAVEIIGAAQDREADIIAMCTHGRRAAAEGRRGSVADKVLRGAAVPVLAAGPLASVPPPGEVLPIRRVLVPLDGSTEAEEALPIALDLAKSLRSEVHLVRMVVPATGNYGLDVPERLGKGLNRKRQRTASAYLASVRSAHKDRAISTHATLGFPAAALRQFITESEIDLVVMTSHSRYATGLWTVGGVADSLLDGPAPVLLVKPARTAIRDRTRSTP
jgi:nucleotide-binding universal stress UspA family protein